MVVFMCGSSSMLLVSDHIGTLGRAVAAQEVTSRSTLLLLLQLVAG